jgi:hypothetical protein
MRYRLTKLQRELLRELRWQGGILFAKSGQDNKIYAELIQKGLIHKEPFDSCWVRYEIAIRGWQTLFASPEQARFD